MPAVTAIIKSIPEFSHRIYGQPDHTILPRVCLLLGSIVIVFVIICYSLCTVRSWRAAQAHLLAELELTASSRSITSTPKSSSARWKSLRYPKYTLRALVRPKQGQGLFEKQAKDARISIGKVVYRGPLTGTAPVGSGGAVERRGRMGHGEGSASSTTATPSGSRGVSRNLRDASSAPSSAPGGQPLSFNCSTPLFPAADDESRGHVGISRTSSPSSFMLAGGSSGEEDIGFAIGQGQSMAEHMSTSTYSPFGYHMTDDEHVSYPTSQYYSSTPPVLEDHSTYQHTEMNFNRPSPTPLVPSTLASQSYYSLYGTQQAEDTYVVPVRTTSPLARGTTGQESDPEYIPVAMSSKTRASVRNSKPTSNTSRSTKSKGPSKRKSHTKSIPIPSKSVTHSRKREPEEEQYVYARDAIPSSSFPSTSPLLPPPPPNSDYTFDPAEVMFPGGVAMDGGIKMVPTCDEDAAHDDLEGEHHHDHHHHDLDIHNTTDEEFGGGWKRHTRVFGGGVCLACATAGGSGGGYYGARVRPEDKRR